MPDITRKITIFGCLLLTSFCFWKVGTGLIDGADFEILPSAQAAVHLSYIPSRVVTTPIQQMRPGMRVVGRNPLRIETEATIDPTPEGWRLVSVRMRKPEGTYFEAELLRPLSWISRHRAQTGAVIELNMPELHVVGAAEVLSISDCPPIDPGDGPVVLSTFKNIAKNVLNIYVEEETEPIGVTAGHPIWSEDRQAFVHSEKLQPGERLRSAVGKTVRITSIEIRAGPEPVYNLEVAGEHVYSVTNSGLLVHNTGPCDPDLYVFDKGSRSARLISSSDINTPRRGVVQYDAPVGPLPTARGPLLPGELATGRFADLPGEVGDNVTGHHMPSSKYIREVLGMKHADGIALNMQHFYPSNTGRHPRTRSFGPKGRDSALLEESFREALGRDIWDARRIYMDDGLYGSDVRRSLREVISEWRSLRPDLF